MQIYMTYKHRWIKSEAETFFGKEYTLQIVAKAYSGKSITDEQRETYKKYLEEKEQFKEILSNELMCYINDNIQELAELFFATPNYQKMQNAFPKVAAGNSSFLHVPPA